MNLRFLLVIKEQDLTTTGRETQDALEKQLAEQWRRWETGRSAPFRLTLSFTSSKL
jgi:hypothetical protein